MSILTREDHLLLRLAEECNEVAQRASKSILFTSEDIQEGKELNNKERLSIEIDDLLGILTMLDHEGFIREPDGTAIIAKATKVEKYIEFSDKCRSKKKCPECLENTAQEELDMFGGLCENCTSGV